MAAPRSRAGICPVLVGPTAVGKTQLILSLVAEFPIEVISLDSRQIYHGLRIGTAQPTAAEMSACRHHLVDYVAPEETYSAQRFCVDFARAWPEIVARGKLPVLVGGAGMYLKALTEGLLELPAGSEEKLPQIRTELARLTDAQLRAALAAEDRASHARLHPNDRYRRQRALEITRLSGRPMSEITAAQMPHPMLGLTYPTIVLDHPMPDLATRITTRTNRMLASGWLDETRSLLTAHAADCPGLASLGYRQLVKHLQGESALDDATAAIVLETRQYAKRQRTWFRKTARIAEGPPESPEVHNALRDAVHTALANLDSPTSAG